MSNVYRIGVTIAMASNGPMLLQSLSRHLIGVHTNVNQLTGGMNRLKLAIGGAMAVAGGVALVKMFEKPLDEARKFEMAVTRFGRFGLGGARTAEMAEFAKGMNIMGSTYVENMERISEAQGIFRQSGLTGSAAMAGAKMAAPLMAKMAFADSSLDEETQASRKHQYASAIRFAEMAGGLNDPKKFNELMNQGYKAITSSGGNVNWELYRQFMATGGVSTRQMDAKALFGEMEPFIGELKSRAGTGYQTAYSSFTGILKPNSARAAEAMKLGLWDPNNVKMTPEGAKLINGVNPIKDPALFAQSQFRYYEKYIRPSYDKAGYNQEQRDRGNVLLAGRTGGGLWSLFDRQGHLAHGSVDSQRKAMGINQAYTAAGGTLNGKIVDMHARYVNLMERLGEAVLPLAVKGLTHLIPIITAVTKWVADNPGKIQVIAKTVLVIAGVLVGFGVVAVAVAAGMAVFAGGWVAMVVAGVAALAGGIATFVALNWGSVKSAAASLWGFVSKVYEIVSFVIQHPFKAIGAAFDVGTRASSPAEIARGQAPQIGFVDFNPGGLAAAAHRSAVPPAQARGGAKSGDVYLDGKKVGAVMDAHLASRGSARFAGSPRADNSMSLGAAAFAGGSR